MSDVRSDSTTSGSDADGASAASGVTLNGAFEALADPRRRAVVSYLREHPRDAVAIATIAAALTDEFDGPVGRVAASLSVTHLPALDERGILEFDRERGTVGYADSPLVDGLLERVDETV